MSSLKDDKRTDTPTTDAPGAARVPVDVSAGALTVAPAADPTPAAAASAVPEAGSLLEGVRMVFTVTLVSALSAGILGFAFTQTKDIIAASRAKELQQAFSYILPAHDNDPLTAAVPLPSEPGAACAPVLYTATNGGATVGYAHFTCTTAAFGPLITLLVGATPDGTVTGVYVLNHQETPGLGAKMTADQDRFAEWRETCEGGCKGNDPFLRQFANRKQGTFDFRVTKDGGAIDSITASTITSRAVADAVAASLTVITAAAAGTGGAE